MIDGHECKQLKEKYYFIWSLVEGYMDEAVEPDGRRAQAPPPTTPTLPLNVLWKTCHAKKCLFLKLKCPLIIVNEKYPLFFIFVMRIFPFVLKKLTC